MPITAFEVGWLGKIEATPDTLETLDATEDGLLPFIDDGGPEAPPPIDYVFDGNTGRGSGSSPIPTRRMPPAGRSQAVVIQTLFRGNADEYTALKPPPNEVHTLLRASGLTAAYAADAWRYTPTPLGNTFSRATIRRYNHGKIWNTRGTVFDFEMAAEGLGAPRVTFNGNGVLAAVPADGAQPAITLPSELIFPALAQAVVGNIGDFAFGGAEHLRSVNITGGRSRNPRVAQNLAGGHGGFFLGYMDPVFTIVMERTAAVLTPFHTSAGIDAEALREAAFAVPLAFRYGTESTERFTVGSAHAQLANVTSSNENGIALVSLEFRPVQGSGDAFYVLFD